MRAQLALFVALLVVRRRSGWSTSSPSACCTGEEATCGRSCVTTASCSSSARSSCWRWSGRPSRASTPSTTTRSPTAPRPCRSPTYLTSSDFGADVAENWQSEYLQFALYILATVYLVQRGLAGVQAARQGGHRVRRGAARRRATPARLPRPRRGAGGFAAVVVQQLARADDGPDLPGLVGWRSPSPGGRPTTQRSCGRSRIRSPRRVPRLAGLLEPHAAELAVGVPRDPVDGAAVDLPAAARLAGVQAGGRGALDDGRRRLTRRFPRRSR